MTSFPSPAPPPPSRVFWGEKETRAREEEGKEQEGGDALAGIGMAEAGMLCSCIHLLGLP